MLEKKDFIGKKIIFFPKTMEDAIAAQKKLFELGFGWGAHGTKVSYLRECLHGGLVVNNGTLYFCGETDKTAYQELSVDSLLNTPGKEEIRQQQFNALAARVDRIEKMVQEIHDEIVGRKSVPHFTKPGQGK